MMAQTIKPINKRAAAMSPIKCQSVRAPRNPIVLRDSAISSSDIHATSHPDLVVTACPGQSLLPTLDGHGQALAEFLVHLAQSSTLQSVNRVKVCQLSRF